MWHTLGRYAEGSTAVRHMLRLLADGRHIERINQLLVMADREKAGREPIPTLSIFYSRTIKCDAPDGERGIDAAKKILGRKRHCAVDSGGRLLAVSITTADVQDQNAGLSIIKPLLRLYPWIETFVVDGGYKNRFIDGVKTIFDRTVQVIKRPEFTKGVVLLPKRWIVEQTIGVLTMRRRLKIDYETLIHVSAAAVLFASMTRSVASVALR